MNDSGSQTTLVAIWEQHRERILTYGHVLNGLLPDDDSPVVLHGRCLRPQDEGVGFHFQFTLAGDLYNGTVVAACFVVQIELVAASAIIVKVDAAPLVEYRDGRYAMVGRHGTNVPIGDKRALWLFFAYSLTPAAARFFTHVRAGEPMDNLITGFAGFTPAPQVDTVDTDD